MELRGGGDGAWDDGVGASGVSGERVRDDGEPVRGAGSAARGGLRGDCATGRAVRIGVGGAQAGAVCAARPAVGGQRGGAAGGAGTLLRASGGGRWRWQWGR